jgi:hypothetical protein
MGTRLPLRCANGALVLIAALGLAAPVSLAQAVGPFKDRSLADALRMLQAGGLRVVFSSATVTPDLRVRREPRGSSLREQLDALLSEHGLAAIDGPGGTVQVVRPPTRIAESRTAPDVGTIDGQAIDALTAAPLADVVVRVEGMAGEARSSSAGRFTLRARPGTRRLVASVAGYATITRAVRVRRAATVAVTLSLSPALGAYREYVAVNGPALATDLGVAAETSLDSTELERLYGTFDEDPMRIVHAFAGVTALDELRSEFVARGSPFRHTDVVVDGVPTHWLLHTAYDRGATGSLAMFPGQVLDQVTLRVGAYPRRYGHRLGPQLDLRIREGSRAGVRLRASAGGTSATLVGEGPLGTTRRGSWLVAGRQSYLEWPTEAEETARTAFGYFDGLAKLAYDVGASHHVAFSLLGGASSIDTEDNLAPNELGGGQNQAIVATLSWRSALRSGFVIDQRAYIVRQRFVNKHQTGLASDSQANDELAYRALVSRPVRGGLFEAGGEIGRTEIEDVPRATAPSSVGGSSWIRAGYVQYAWPVTPAISVSPGVRVASSTAFLDPAVSRWVLGEWTLGPRWTINGSIGISEQLPELRDTLGETGAADLVAERALHIDAGVEHRLTAATSWRATVFHRVEDDILRGASRHLRLSGGAREAPAPEPAANALHGSSHGVELVVERRSTSGLSGWAAYAFGKTQYTDAARAETYWGDFDQRHALNLFGSYRITTRTSVGATFRAGTNFPIPGYWTAADGKLFVGGGRNRVRLPAYSRLDLRGSHSLAIFGGDLTLFAEVLNVLDRINLGLANPSIDPSSGEATGLTDALLPRRVSGGAILQF